MGFRTLKELDATDGTVQLVDATHQHQHVRKSNLVLIPQPSSDPNDPLRWPQWKKMLAFGTVCMFTFLNNWAGDGPAGGFANIAAYFDIGISQTSGLLSWFVLTLGLANFFWVPTAIYFGKTPVFLVACLLLFLCCIWAAVATSFNSLLAATIVGAFAGGSTEALGAAIVNDLFFLHERGSKMGYYIVAISWGSNIGPLCGGFIIGSVGWRWQKWISAIFLGLNLIMVFFFVPETRFDRGLNPTAAAEPVGNMEPKGKPKDITKSITSTFEEYASNESGILRQASSRTVFQELNPWSGIDTKSNYLNLFLRPFPLILYPACIFATLAYSISLAPTVVFSIVSSFVFEAPPYNFTAGINGLVNIPGLIGNFIGAIIGGILTDKWAERRARLNNGIFEPESRLTLLLFPAIIVTAGLIMIGFGCERKLHWAVIYVGFGFISVGLTAVANIGMTYVMDSYFVVAPECLLLINGLKNVIAFGFIYAAVPWVQGQGFERCFGGLAGIFVAILLLALPLWVWGARIRHHTAANWALISW